MLQLRARGFALRDTFADALCGLTTVEEARDIPTKGAVAEIPPSAVPESRVAQLAKIVSGSLAVEASFVTFKKELDACTNQDELERLGVTAQTLPTENKDEARALYLEKMQSISH